MKYFTVTPPLRSLWDDLDSLTSNLFNPTPVRGYSPKVDVREATDHYLLEADIPGFSEKDVEVKVKDGLLTISSLKSTAEAPGAQTAPTYLLRERASASFSRSFKLPKDVDQERIEATYKTGVLELKFFKREEPEAKAINIRSA